MEVYFPTYPEKTVLADEDLFLIADSQDLKVDGKKKFKRVKAQNLPSVATSVESILYAALLIKKNAGTLTAGKWYLITDATVANIQLLVQATSVSTIGTDAKSPDFPQDVINYNFLTDTIIWRWDTISDISVAQDLRNLIGLTIGSGCTQIHTEQNVTGSIGTNCTNIVAGSDCVLTIGGNNSNIELGRSSTLSVQTNKGTNILMGDSASLVSAHVCNLLTLHSGVIVSGATGDIDGVVFHVTSDLSASTLIYSTGGTKEVFAVDGGAGAMVYYDDSYVQHIVNVETA